MALSACMWTGVSGLLAHGEKMNVVGNNIANVNTVGFKGQRMDFADFVYQNAFSNQGITQIGRGVKVGAIMQNFQTGPFETSTESTDLAIDGRGFFKVKKTGTDQSYYTRAGNFRFNETGYLVDPNRLAVQGWKIENNNGVMRASGGSSPNLIDDAKESAIKGTGVPTDIKLDTWSVIPQATTKTTVKVNLPINGPDNCRDASNPLASLASKAWDGTQPPLSPTTPPIAEGTYAYTTSLEVYDESGTKHTLTVYFDKVNSADYEGGSNNTDMWEYIVTMDPASDQRQFWDSSLGDLRNVNETAMGGLLMAGTMTFTKGGQLVNQTAYTWGGTETPNTDPTHYEAVRDPSNPLNSLQVYNRPPVDADGNIDMSNWKPTAISSNGLPILVPNFSGVLDAQTAGSTQGERYGMELDFGLSAGNLTLPWENGNSLANLAVPAYEPNPRYTANDPASYPKYIALNEDYDPSLDLWANPNAYKYKINGVDYTTSPPTPLTTYQAALVQMMNADKNLKLTANSLAGGTFPTKAGTYSVSYPLTTPLTISVTPDDGSAVQTLTLDPSVNPGDAADVTAVEDAIIAKVRRGTIVDSSVMQAGTPVDANGLALFNKPVVIDPYACTSYDSPFSANLGQNGYGHGDLTDWHVDTDGVLYGMYSNGVTLPLWQLTMYDFTSPQGLRREGNNLFSATRYSGDEKSGAAGSAGLGNINGYTLEQSNVDMSTEFVLMITTQRGFQGNSKVITTTDTMLDTVINMKR